jgi:hypothetical protein
MELDQEMNPEQPFDDAADRQNEAEEIRNAWPPPLPQAATLRL